MTSQADRDKSHALRIAAEMAGEMKFESAMPCPYGHALKYTSSGKCVDCTIARVEEKRKKGIYCDSLWKKEKAHE